MCLIKIELLQHVKCIVSNQDKLFIENNSHCVEPNTIILVGSLMVSKLVKMLHHLIKFFDIFITSTPIINEYNKQMFWFMCIEIMYTRMYN
jgi:hypothetical protein